jgi:hypothetical protein
VPGPAARQASGFVAGLEAVRASRRPAAPGTGPVTGHLGGGR